MLKEYDPLAIIQDATKILKIFELKCFKFYLILQSLLSSRITFCGPSNEESSSLQASSTNSKKWKYFDDICKNFSSNLPHFFAYVLGVTRASGSSEYSYIQACLFEVACQQHVSVMLMCCFHDVILFLMSATFCCGESSLQTQDVNKYLNEK
jgi:hypothetical protein